MNFPLENIPLPKLIIRRAIVYPADDLVFFRCGDGAGLGHKACIYLEFDLRSFGLY